MLAKISQSLTDAACKQWPPLVNSASLSPCGRDICTTKTEFHARFLRMVLQIVHSNMFCQEIRRVVPAQHSLHMELIVLHLVLQQEAGNIDAAKLLEPSPLKHANGCASICVKPARRDLAPNVCVAALVSVCSTTSLLETATTAHVLLHALRQSAPHGMVPPLLLRQTRKSVTENVLSMLFSSCWEKNCCNRRYSNEKSTNSLQHTPIFNTRSCHPSAAFFARICDAVILGYSRASARSIVVEVVALSSSSLFGRLAWLNSSLQPRLLVGFVPSSPTSRTSFSACLPDQTISSPTDDTFQDSHLLYVSPCVGSKNLKLDVKLGAHHFCKPPQVILCSCTCEVIAMDRDCYPIRWLDKVVG